MQKLASMFINRELSWLAFNTRVLEQSDKNIPLLERLKFLAIYGTNLDEFYMIRVAGLKQLYLAGISIIGADELKPSEQLFWIREYLHEENALLEHHLDTVLNKLSKAGVYIKKYLELSKDMQKACDEYFFSYIFQIIIPIAIDATHPFPHLINLSSSIAIKLCEENDRENIKFAMIKIPTALPKFYHQNGIFIPIESIIKAHIKDIFPGYDALSETTFRVTRNADMVIAREEADDFMILLEQGLKLRRKGVFVRLQIQKNCDLELLDFLQNHLKVSTKDTYEFKELIDHSSLLELVNHRDFSHLLWLPYQPKSLLSKGGDIFELCDKNDILIYQPYESFDMVEHFIEDACHDEAVVSIRMSLYRVEQNSTIVKALIDAANKGKQVTVMVELRARFDEENNLAWAKSLEKAGAHVIYGITGFKAHAKLAQIIKHKNSKLEIYNHISTGNYNAKSAQIYTDVSYFSKARQISTDTTTFFHILSGFSKNQSLKTLAMSPNQIKEKLLSMIETEAKSSNGKIIAKMNALVDPDIIMALYKASQKGVQIDLIIRGACCLKPGLEFSKNIRVRSIIGKYLEHARIFYFKHSKPNYFFSSADWMSRNLKRRLELMCPVFYEPLREKLKQILDFQLLDDALAYELNHDGKYERIRHYGPAFNSQFAQEACTIKAYENSEKGDK